MYSNFIGPESKFVASGSDDGRIFIWETETGTLVNILGIYSLAYALFPALNYILISSHYQRVTRMS